MTDPVPALPVHDCVALAARLAVVEYRLTDGFASRDKALDVALAALNQHLATLNEFRAAMSDQAAQFVTRPEHDDLKEQASKYISRAEHEQLIQQINAQALDARSIAAQYVPRIDMATMVTRVENVEKAQTQIQARYAMVALVFSTMVIIANLIAVWWHPVLPLGH